MYGQATWSEMGAVGPRTILALVGPDDSHVYDLKFLGSLQ